MSAVVENPLPPLLQQSADHVFACESRNAAPPALTRTALEAVETVTFALPVIEPTVAVTRPLPVADPAVNVVAEPFSGETDPGADVVQAAPETPTGLPY